MEKGGRVYNEHGRFMGSLAPFELGEFLKRENGMLLVESLTPDWMESYTTWLIYNGKVMSDKRGKPNIAKLSKYWIVTSETWKLGELSVKSLQSLRRLFTYMDVGVAPTPGSLGQRTMLYVWDEKHLSLHTTLSLKAEKFVLDNSPSAIVVNNGYVGRDISRASVMDNHFAFVSKYHVQPDGTAEFFGPGDSLYYPTYFCHAFVKIRRELPVGIFPVKNEQHRIVWPTLPGVYETYLWKEQVIDAQDDGCLVKPLEGYGWQKFNGDNLHWTEWIYDKRRDATDEELEKQVKGVGVAAIGKQGMGRTYYVLRTGDNYDIETDWPVIDHHVPLYDLWVHPVHDNLGAPMPHWQRRTVSEVNREVIRFAKPFAERGRLVSIDHDAVMVLAGDGDNMYVRKHSIEAITAPVGSWLWCLHHNVHYYALRVWTSDEEPHRYGKHLLQYVRDGVLV